MFLAGRLIMFYGPRREPLKIFAFCKNDLQPPYNRLRSQITFRHVLGMMTGCLVGMLVGLDLMPFRSMGMVGCFLMISGLVMLGSMIMMLGGLFVVLSSLFVRCSGFL